MILSCKIEINLKFILNFQKGLEFYPEKIPLRTLVERSPKFFSNFRPHPFKTLAFAESSSPLLKERGGGFSDNRVREGVRLKKLRFENDFETHLRNLEPQTSNIKTSNI
jgi:hypothetical protein